MGARRASAVVNIKASGKTIAAISKAISRRRFQSTIDMRRSTPPNRSITPVGCDHDQWNPPPPRLFRSIAACLNSNDHTSTSGITWRSPTRSGSP